MINRVPTLIINVLQLTLPLNSCALGLFKVISIYWSDVES